MDGTILNQGSFITTGTTSQIIQLRSDYDWIHTYNLTTINAAGGGTGTEFMWFRGMNDGSAIEYVKTAVTNATAVTSIATGGFYHKDSSSSPLGALNTTITAVSNAAIPIVSATSTATLNAGDIVRLINVAGATQLNGVDFEIDTVVANTSFRLPYMAQIVAGTTGSFYKVEYPSLFFPRRRYISKITAADNAVITTTVAHGLVAGQKFRVLVPAAYGMTQINNLMATAISVTDSTITTDIDSSAFTAYAWPLTALGGTYSHAIIVPVGEAAEVPYQNRLDDATRNLGYVGVILGYGADSPAGVDNDLIFWQAGRSIDL